MTSQQNLPEQYIDRIICGDSIDTMSQLPAIVTDQPNQANKAQIRQAITQAKLHLVNCINKLPIDEWTDADVNIQYEIMANDPDIQALIDREHK